MFITKLWNKEKQKPKSEVLYNLDLIEDISDEASANVSGGMSGFILLPGLLIEETMPSLISPDSNNDSFILMPFLTNLDGLFLL